MEAVKISFIIPVYNAVQYLSACLDSIYLQDMNENDFEVICVNDCSPDNSRKIVLKYQDTHKNLRLIDHTENRKAGGARNTGINAAKGEWIWFVDADDTIELGALQKVFDHCREDELDVLCFNYHLLYDDRMETEHVFDNSINVQNGVDFLLATFGDGLIYHMGFPWRAIYRRSVLLEHGISFPEHLLYGEDTTFMVEGVMYSKSVKAINDVLYNYRQNVATSSSAQLADMKGERIYESIFHAGELVLELKNKAQFVSTELAKSIEKGLPWFVNRLFMRLVKTSVKERVEFYQILKINVCRLNAYMNRQNRLIIEHPLLGRLMLNALEYFYKLKYR